MGPTLNLLLLYFLLFPSSFFRRCKSQASKLNFRNPLQWSTNSHESREQCEQNPQNTDHVPGSRQLFPTLLTFVQLLMTLTLGIPVLSLSLSLFFSLLLSSHRHLLSCLFCYIFNSFIQFDIFSLGTSPKYSNKLIYAERVPHIPSILCRISHPNIC